MLKKTILTIVLAAFAVACTHDPSSTNPAAITGLQANKWTWVPFADAKCRDGSSTGIAINLGSNPGTQLLDLCKHHIKTHPGATFGVVSADDDDSATVMFGCGFNNCSGHQNLTAAQFAAGLQDLESRLRPYSNAGAFVFSGSAHTSLLGSSFYTRAAGAGPTGAGSVVLNDWVGDLLNGIVTNVGP